MRDREGWGQWEARSGQGGEANVRLWACAPNKCGSCCRAQSGGQPWANCPPDLLCSCAGNSLRGRARRTESR